MSAPRSKRNSAIGKRRQSGGTNYEKALTHVFISHYKKSPSGFQFERQELVFAAKELGIPVAKNLGDVVYSYKFRRELPDDIRKTAPDGKHWLLTTAGNGKYEFSLVDYETTIVPRPHTQLIKIPDSTPEIIARHALSDEQALLAKLRYNRLIDIFLSLTTYSLQNHLRTQVTGIGQIEIDEIYLGLDTRGDQYIIPVQAKGGKDRLSIVQTKQDMAFCKKQYPDLTCRPVSAQFITGENEGICLFELLAEREKIVVCDERHYTLVPADDIKAKDLDEYRNSRTETESAAD